MQTQRRTSFQVKQTQKTLFSLQHSVFSFLFLFLIFPLTSFFLHTQLFFFPLQCHLSSYSHHLFALSFHFRSLDLLNSLVSQILCNIKLVSFHSKMPILDIESQLSECLFAKVVT